jgi:hypothetical protein
MVAIADPGSLAEGRGRINFLQINGVLVAVDSIDTKREVVVE